MVCYRPHPKDEGSRRMREGNIFSLSTLSGGGTPSQVRMIVGVPCPRSGWGGTPSQIRTGGGIPILLTGGYHHPADGGYPHSADGGGPHPRSRWGYPGGPPIETGWQYPPLHPDLDGLPPTPPHPHPHQETDQHSEYLLRGGRYASYAGGLSCLKSMHTVHA